MNVVYVNKDDRIIGSGTIDNAVNNGIIVRISRVFLANPKGELLLQMRSPNHKSLPNKWDQTAAGHVDAGENYEQAAYRELKEEMGIKSAVLVPLKKYYAEEADEDKIKKRFNTLYIGTYDGSVQIDHDEVTDFRWISIDDLKKEMEKHPDDFTQGAINAFKIYQQYNSSLGLVKGIGKRWDVA